MLHCLIIDDEPLAVKLLSDYVLKHEDTTLAAAVTSPIAAMKVLDSLNVDLVLLDIQMPELTGLEVAKILQGKYPVIFISAYESYALEGYSLDVIDYLLKPVSFDRFSQAINKAKQRALPLEKVEDLSNNADTALYVKSGYKIVRLPLEDIVYMEGLGDYTRIYTGQKQLLTLEKMKHFESVLPPHAFIRVHKSYLIAIDRIDYIERNHVVISQQKIPIGATYADAFWALINKSGS